MAKKRKAKMRRDVVSPFRDKVWDLFKEHASGMDGADVVLALKQAGEEIWAIGIDESRRAKRYGPLGSMTLTAA